MVPVAESEVSDAYGSGPGLSRSVLSTQLLSLTPPSRPQKGIKALFSFSISPWKPLSYTIKNASLHKVTRAGNFPLVPSA